MKTLMVACSFYAALAAPLSVLAENSTGVGLDEVVTLSSGSEPLRLRGAAVKNSAHQSIYVGGLYLEQGVGDASHILQSETAKRFVLYCENSTIKPEALLRALNLGFVANHSESELTELRPMLERFNAIFNAEIKQGDQVWVDFVPGRGTEIAINEQVKGVIPGKPFYDAFLKVWIGDKPVNPQFKRQLLGE